MDLWNDFIRPLAGSIIPAAVFAGLFFGRIYNRRLDISESFSYHALFAGWAFIFFVFLFRFLSGVDIGKIFGWFSVAFLWLVYCLFMWIGQNYLPLAEQRIRKLFHR